LGFRIILGLFVLGWGNLALIYLMSRFLSFFLSWVFWFWGKISNPNNINNSWASSTLIIIIFSNMLKFSKIKIKMEMSFFFFFSQKKRKDKTRQERI